LATILNDVVTLRIGRAFLNSHCLFANKAAQKINQRAFIVVQMMSFDNTALTQIVRISAAMMQTSTLVSPVHFQPFISLSAGRPAA
jgi:hypothetical protein